MNVNKQRFLVLDVFRGLAAILVALYHFSINFNDLYNVNIVKNGHRFVDFFFVLSGFIIYYNYNKVQNFYEQKQFLYKRFLRIYPLHFAILIVFLLFEIAKLVLFRFGLFNSPAFGNSNLVSFIQNLFLLQAFENSSADLSWNYPSWSISSEMMAYIIFALTIVYISKATTKVKPYLLLLLSIAGLTLFYNNIFPLVTRCIYAFFIGCAMYHVYLFLEKYPAKFKRTQATLIEVLAVFILIFYSSYMQIGRIGNYVLPLIYAAVIITFAFEKGWVSSKLSSIKLLNKAGVYSYSIYMTHALIAEVIHIIIIKILKIHSIIVKDIAVIPFIIIVYFVSILTYRYLELDGKLLLNKVLVRKKNIIIENI